eukprot:COSAG05_NODE_727_length_7701_cov_13.129308_4_plen_193_part_00
MIDRRRRGRLKPPGGSSRIDACGEVSRQLSKSGTTKTTARKQHNNNTKSKIKILDHTRLVERGLNRRHRRQRQYAAKERAAGGHGEERRKQKAPERHRQGGTGEGAGGQGSQTPAPPRSGRRKVLKVARSVSRFARPPKIPPNSSGRFVSDPYELWRPDFDIRANEPISLDSKAGPRVLDVRGRRRMPAYRG